MRRWISWNIFFRLQEAAKGHATLRILREMEAADCLSNSGLEELQCRKLQEFIGYTYAHVPYVRRLMEKAGLEPGDLREPRDLARLPLMGKATVRDHRAELRSDLATGLSPFTTGGSTGEPLIFDVGKGRTAARVACRQRVARWWGLSVGDPEFALWGSPVELTHQDWIRQVRDRLLATRLLPAFEMNEATITRYLDLLQTQPCRQIFGYPSAIDLLCREAQKQRRQLRNLGIRAAFVTGEVLFPYQRERISEVLNCPVADGYGGRDSGFISHECPQGGMHILADAVLVEVLDEEGRPTAAGQPGEIVVTDLYSHEAPFLRYRTGDMGVLSERRCRCGRALPLFERIEGRSNDAVLTADGRIINSLSLIYAVREIPGIERFRIYQKSLRIFHVQIVRTNRFPGGAEAAIRTAWTKLLRSPIQVTFEYLQALPAERSGKFRHFISEVSPEAGPPDHEAAIHLSTTSKD